MTDDQFDNLIFHLRAGAMIALLGLVTGIVLLGWAWGYL
jgi:hypothetical protein